MDSVEVTNTGHVTGMMVNGDGASVSNAAPPVDGGGGW